MGNLLRVDDLQIELVTANGVIRAVDGVSFCIDAGETVTIIGESGSGKSTTAMGILGLLPDDLAVLSGKAVFKGQDILGNTKILNDIRGKHIALIPQDPMTALSPVHTIGSQLREAVRHSGVTAKKQQIERAVQLLEQVRIPYPDQQLDKYPHQLSGGMLQRVLIAGALAAGPELIVADEPTSALDVTVQAGILDLLLELQERTGIGMLVITHDLGVARVGLRSHLRDEGRTFCRGPVVPTFSSTHRKAPTHQKLLDAIPQLGPWDGDPARSTQIGASAWTRHETPLLAVEDLVVEYPGSRRSFPSRGCCELLGGKGQDLGPSSANPDVASRPSLDRSSDSSQPTSGRILVDGNDIAQMSEKSLRPTALAFKWCSKIRTDRSTSSDCEDIIGEPLRLKGVRSKS